MKKKILRFVSVFLSINLLSQTVFIPAVFALTAGPGAPEFSSFEPVATTDMVNAFSGDFNYNLPVLEIPGPDGGGYAVSLSYHSGTNAEEEASWVGYGFSLNPGAINRNTRGFPDDYNHTPVIHYNKAKLNWSASSTAQVGLDVFSNKLFNKGNNANDESSKGISVGLSLTKTVRFNNYQGFAVYKGFGVRAKGLVSVGLDANKSAQGTTYSADISVNPNFSKAKNEQTNQENHNAKSEAAKATPTKKSWIEASAEKWKGEDVARSVSRSVSDAQSALGSTHGIWSFANEVLPTSSTSFQAASYNWQFGIGATVTPVPISGYFGVSGNVTIHKSLEVNNLSAYGYLYNPAGMNDNTLSDYGVERNLPYSKQNFYLGIPFSNADNFMVSGEGLSGGFRFYPTKQGHFYPNSVSNKLKIRQSGFNLSIGLDFGIGMSFGRGPQSTDIKNWKNIGNTSNFSFSGQADGAFRFTNDMGGSISYNKAPQEKLQTASLNTLTNFPGFKEVEPIVPVEIGSQLDTASRKASSFIEYHSYMDTTLLFNKSANIPQTRFHRLFNVNSSNSGNINGISEIGVWNADGLNYVYGLPVYNRNDANLVFDVKPSEVPSDRYIVYKPIALQSNQNKYGVDVSQHVAVAGEIKPIPYTSNYLLTQILSPDYIDVGNNGIDSLDFGGWTQFSYRQKYGGGNTNGWYRWRTPYSGLLYNKNSISDKSDDRGAVVAGEKEVYYLKSIETKTHIAFFITNKSVSADWQDILTKNKLNISGSTLTGSGLSRGDGLGAALIDGSGDQAANNRNAKGSQQLEYLERIVLISKNRSDRAIKTVRFQYDYSLVQNLPNHVNGEFPGSRTKQGTGKLTLKKVWFEYEGITRGKISPYEFIYEYKKQSAYDDNVQQNYPEATQYANLFSQDAQNPDYTPHYLDPWGNLMAFGKERKKYMIPWIYQGTYPVKNYGNGSTWSSEFTSSPATSYDPAAWQLKQIILPSGGEIHIQYEQKDYASVQNRSPMAMCSLLRANDVFANSPSYLINCRDLGLNPDDKVHYLSDLQEQQRLLTQYFKDEKLYFKFLYAFKSDSSPELDNCKSDYITGYARVDSVDNKGLPIGVVIDSILTNENKYEKHLRIQLIGQNSGDSQGSLSVPRQVCYDFYSTQRYGKDETPDCQSQFENDYDPQVNSHSDDLLNANPLNVFSRQVFLGGITRAMMGNMGMKIPDKASIGQNLSLPLSFLKIPMIKPKKGGGLRVKRLLIYDPGIESGDAGLYGQEYLYQDFKEVNGQMRVISSGVATNEPADAREENPMIGFLPKKNQSWYGRITAGEDREQTEGPLGETLLPGPSVGHSRVVVRNIHGGETGSGFTVSEYFTVKDYPFDMIYKGGANNFDYPQDSPGVSYTSLTDNSTKDFFIIPAGPFHYKLSKTWAAQGYMFIQNTMHGQIKRNASYAGDYNLLDNGMYAKEDINKFKRISEQAYQYFEPGEKVRMFDTKKLNGTYYWDVPGKESEVAMESRQVSEGTLDFNLEIGLTIAFPPPVLLYVTPAIGTLSYSTQGISTHVTAKVLRYPVILKKVVAFQDGVTSVNENLAFNPQTGTPVLTRTADGFDKITITSQGSPRTIDGSIYTLTLPAAWYYKGMGPKSANPFNSNELSAFAGKVITYSSLGNPLRESDATGWDKKAFKNVLNASAQTFSQNWFLPPTGNSTDRLISQLYSISGNDRANLNKIWRPKSAYAYRENILSSNINGSSIYKGGVMDSLQLFGEWNLTPKPVINKWVLSNQVSYYSPHGNAIEEKNVLGIYSTVVFGYRNTMPVMVASNARFGSIAFEDFENNPGSVSTVSHSGYNSIALNANTILFNNLLVDEHLIRKGALVKFWLQGQSNPAIKLQLSNGSSVIPVKISQTGEWTLWSASFTPDLLPALGTTFNLAVIYSGQTINMDDVRFQPTDSQSTCYVYDTKTLRLVTQFDDQHFGLFYQYNNEGQLVRKLIETTDGLKTIQETQYNIPKKARTQ